MYEHYITIEIPNEEQFNRIFDYLIMNDYDVWECPEYNELDIAEEQFIDVETILIDEQITYTILIPC